MKLAALVPLALLAFFLLAPVAAATAGDPVDPQDGGPRICVPRHDGQDLLCNEFHYSATNELCWNISLNPPLPGTYWWNTLCTPVHCPSWLCASSLPIDVAGAIEDDLEVVLP